MADSEQWFVYESESFLADVPTYLGDFELEALKRQLATKPFSGKAVSPDGPLLSVDFGRATILYAVHPGRRTIALIQIGRATGRIETEPDAKERLKERLDLLRKGGYMGAGKRIFDWLFETLKDWL